MLHAYGVKACLRGKALLSKRLLLYLLFQNDGLSGARGKSPFYPFTQSINGMSGCMGRLQELGWPSIHGQSLRSSLCTYLWQLMRACGCVGRDALDGMCVANTRSAGLQGRATGFAPNHGSQVLTPAGACTAQLPLQCMLPAQPCQAQYTAGTITPPSLQWHSSGSCPCFAAM